MHQNRCKANAFFCLTKTMYQCIIEALQRGDIVSLRKVSVAIYQQLIDYFQFEIASGRLLPGQRIDSIRELALFFKVNPNTVQKALIELERDGLIYTDRTNGKFVTENDQIIIELKENLSALFSKAYVSQCLSLGLSEKQALINIKKYWRKENE